MKVSNPKFITNLSDSWSAKTNSSMKPKIFLLLLLTFFKFNLQAQTQTNLAAGAVHLNQFLSTLDQKGTTYSGQAASSYLLSLLNDVKPAAYLSNGTLTVTDSNPLVLFTDVRSLNNLGEVVLTTATPIELVFIKIRDAKDLARGLNLGQLSNINGIRYVYLLMEENIPTNILLQSISNANGSYQIIYNTVIPN